MVDITPWDGKALIHNTVKITISITILVGVYLHVNEILSDFIFSLSDLMFCSISVTCSLVDVGFIVGPSSVSMLSRIDLNVGYMIRLVTLMVHF